MVRWQARGCPSQPYSERRFREKQKVLGMSEVIEVTDDEFSETVEKSEFPVLVDFSATWCQPCKALSPIIEAVAKEYNGRLVVRKVDIDKARDTVNRFDIRGVPTCIFFRSGAEVDRFIGNRDLKDVKALVDKVLAG